MPGLGDEFRAAREARRLSLSDVSEQIHIRSVYLQSIEEEDWSAIAAPVYVRGFIRTYARFLGLDPEQAVERFNATLGDAAQKLHDPVLVARSQRRRPSPWLWIAIVAAIVLLGFVGYNYYEFQTEKGPGPAALVGEASAPASPAATSTPAPATPAPKPTLGAGRTLEVRLTQTSWLLVSVDGSRQLEGTFPAGTLKEFHGGKKVSIRAGNAGGVDLKVDGKELGAMGHSGSVVDRVIPLVEE